MHFDSASNEFSPEEQNDCVSEP